MAIEERKRKTVVSKSRHSHIIHLLQEAASKAIAEDDPWAKHCLPKIPAERVIRHMYHPETQTWTSDETICKIQTEPFTHGAMRFCYRMKMLTPPRWTSTNHRFHKKGWSHASNYVAKAYCDKSGVELDESADVDAKDLKIDTSDNAKKAVQQDIILQYEAQRWSNHFNHADPPSKIDFIFALAIEFPNRSGRPWLAVERFISGHDSYGTGFVKHNTNSGFVDTELRRVTPQVFSAYSFYKSEGRRLVADIQGVGDLYTDPQVLSSDYRFGDGDLGPRGMALFFKTFRACGMSDAMGIPIFPLSKNELKHQTKYEEDEITLSDDEDELSLDGLNVKNKGGDRFQKLDQNRMRRSSMLRIPKSQLMSLGAPSPEDEPEKTAKRSNLQTREAVSSSLQRTMSIHIENNPKRYTRTRSEVDEVATCLERAKHDIVFTQRDFHRYESGELRERHFKTDSFHKSTRKNKVSPPMMPTDQTRANLGKVHYQLAVLHGMGRFPEIVASEHGEHGDDPMAHDSFSVLFHLSYAAALHNAPACLTLGRLHAGLDTVVSDLLNKLVPVDFDSAKTLLHRAMTSPHAPPTQPKAAAGCLLLQILHDERKVMKEKNANGVATDAELMQVVEETLQLLDTLEAEKKGPAEPEKGETAPSKIEKGDRVDANYCLEGSFYPGTVTEVSGDGEQITVQYDDDGSSETLAKEHVRALPKAAVPTIQQGDRVDANYCLEGSFYPGTVTDVSADGEQITVQYDDDGSSETLAKEHVRAKPDAAAATIRKGDRVEANYCMEGSFYPGTVTDVSADGAQVTVQYDDDGSSETLAKDHVKSLAAPQTPQSTTPTMQKGDRVEANYCMEGTFYSGTVTEVSADGEQITVQYDDDGSSETLTKEHVRSLEQQQCNEVVAAAAKPAPMSDAEAFGASDTDDKLVMEYYEIQAELAMLKEAAGETKAAAALYQEAADGAMDAGKMKTATQWSLKATELQG